MKILMIGGGNMGGAMLPGLSAHQITVYEKSEARRAQLKEQFPSIAVGFADPVDLSGFDAVLLAIKPQVFPHLSFTGQCGGVVSIMAGVTLSTIKEGPIADHYVRAMPNLGAFKGKSATAFTGDAGFREQARAILETIGKCVWVETEKELDIATALAGSGPAYLALAAEALADGAVNMGLKREDAQNLAQALMEGTAAVLEEFHPAVLKDMVMSPGGTTAAGCEALEENGVRNGFMKAVRAAYERAKSLS